MDQSERINTLENLIESFLDGRMSKAKFKANYSLYWGILNQ